MDENNGRYCYVTAIINSFEANRGVIMPQYWKTNTQLWKYHNLTAVILKKHDFSEKKIAVEKISHYDNCKPQHDEPI